MATKILEFIFQLILKGVVAGLYQNDLFSKISHFKITVVYASINISTLISQSSRNFILFINSVLFVFFRSKYIRTKQARNHFICAGHDDV